MKVGDLNKTIIGSLNKEGSPIIKRNAKMPGTGKVQKDPEILEATEKFEGMFLQYLMNEMMKNTGDGFMGKGLSGDIFKGLFVEKMSEQLIGGRGMGISDMVYDYFEKTGLTNRTIPLDEEND